MKLKIRFLINTLGGGGAEKVLVDLLRQLDPQKYDLSLVTVLGGIHDSALPEHVQHRQIVKSRSTWLNRQLSKVIYKLPAKVFVWLFLRGHYDIEIAYLEGKPTRFMAAKKTKGAKLAFVHCDISVNNIVAPCYRSLDECLREYQSFSKVCFVSEQSRLGFKKTVGELENSCVIHNVLDIGKIYCLAECEPPVHFTTTGWKLVTVGRLAKEKAFDRLLRIVAVLEKQYPMELWIIGEGPEREALERLISELGIHSVKLLGYQSNPYMLVKQADLFVCSSIFEGYSTAVTEALALGIPVITTDCAGMDEILAQGKYGIIVENGEQSLQDGLACLFEAPVYLEKLKQAVRIRSEALTSEQALNEYTKLFSGMGNC